MMKRVVFAHIAIIYEFDTITEQMSFIIECNTNNKGWYINSKWHEKDRDVYCVEVFKPYRNYNGGW